MVAQGVWDAQVAGSNPATRTMFSMPRSPERSTENSIGDIMTWFEKLEALLARIAEKIL